MLCDTQSHPQSFWTHPGIIWKNFFSSNVWSSESIFAYETDQPFEHLILWGFSKPQVLFRRKLWLTYDRGIVFRSYCNCLSSGFCLKWFLAEKINFELWHRRKSAQIHVKVKENRFKSIELSGFWAVSKFKIDFFQQEIILNKIRSTESCNMIRRSFPYHI